MSEASQVTLVFRKPGGVQYAYLPWVAGKALRLYLHDPSLTQFGMIGLATKSRMITNDRRKQRLASIPASGDVIFFVNPATGYV